MSDTNVLPAGLTDEEKAEREVFLRFHHADLKDVYKQALALYGGVFALAVTFGGLPRCDPRPAALALLGLPTRLRAGDGRSPMMPLRHRTVKRQTTPHSDLPLPDPPPSTAMAKFRAQKSRML